jgi:flagellar biosynthesis protein FlhG
MQQPRPVRVIAVASGKGGVGKTNVSVNLATSLAMRGRKVLILDADLGLANVDVMLGLKPEFNLAHVISGQRTLEEIIIEAPGGIRVIPASSGVQRMAELNPAEHAGLIRAFGELSSDIDVLIVDVAAGISDSVVSFSKAAQEVVVVVCDEPASITDAYALIKLLNRDHGVRRFRILANMVHTPQEAREVFNKLVKVTDRFLEEVVLDLLGAIPYDENLRKAVKRQRAVVELFPRSKIAQAFQSLAQKVDNLPLPQRVGGYLAFFLERMLQSSQNLSGDRL